MLKSSRMLETERSADIDRPMLMPLLAIVRGHEVHPASTPHIATRPTAPSFIPTPYTDLSTLHDSYEMTKKRMWSESVHPTIAAAPLPRRRTNMAPVRR